MITHLVFDGVADGPLAVGLDVIGTAGRLVRAGLAAGPAQGQRLVSLDGRSVYSQAGRPVAVDGTFDAEASGAGDVLVLPGLGAASSAEVDAMLARPDIVRGAEGLVRVAAGGALVAASCSATFVLAASGLLDGREATTTWWLGPEFAGRFPRVKLRPDQMVVESDRVLTAGSALAHADLVLAIAARTMGPSLAHMVARYLVLDARPSQARYMITEHLRTADPVMRTLEHYIQANLATQLTLDDMARATTTSPRTLTRMVRRALGTTPQRFAQRLRMAHAVHLLETSRAPVDAIAAQVGYADAAAFRRVFRRETGTTPSQRRPLR